MVEEDDIREMRREIEEIRDEVADINHVQSLMARADGRIATLVLGYFRTGATETKVAIYQTVDGKRNGSEIASAVGIDQAQVSRYGRQMVQQDILGDSWYGAEKIYHHTHLERAIHLSTLLRELVDH